MYMNKLIIIFTVLLSGCASVQNWVPSFWDDNQSRSIIDVRSRVESIDCSQPQLPQSQAIARELEWFRLYSESKGSLQKDVIRVTEPMAKTVSEWRARGEGSTAYCGIKKQLLQQQSARAAAVILGRW
jgi:hypothetical protein